MVSNSYSWGITWCYGKKKLYLGKSLCVMARYQGIKVYQGVYFISDLILFFCFQSKVYTRTPTMYLDFKLQPNANITQNITRGWTAFAYVLKNDVCFGMYDVWQTCLKF